MLFRSILKTTLFFFKGKAIWLQVMIIRLSALYSFVRLEDEPEVAPDRRLSVLATSFQSVTSESYDTRVLRTTHKCSFVSRSTLIFQFGSTLTTSWK